LILYLVWPPSQEALYHKAEDLMASKQRSDWITARDEYFESLERLSGNPYREQIQKWRDKILVNEAQGRAKYLTAPVETPLSKANNRAENEFVVAHAVVASATKRHDDPTAVTEWKKLAALLNPDDPEERGWYLLALESATEVENAMRDTRLFIEKQMKIADEAFLGGHPEQAHAIRDELVKQYKDYPYLKDLIQAIPIVPSSPQAPPPDSAPSRKEGAPARPPGAAGKTTESQPPASAPSTTPPEPAKAPDSQPPREVDQQSFSEFRSYDCSLIDGLRPVR
jgi:eukaryotic-like serine/threonine-protein kinase